MDTEKIKETLQKLHDSSIFEEAYTHAKWNREYSPYTSKETFEHRLSEVASELQELKEAYHSGDFDHSMEEMGDLLFDVLHLFVFAEERGYTPRKILQSRIAKQVWRAPGVYEGIKITEEEHLNTWKLRKSLAKEGKCYNLYAEFADELKEVEKERQLAKEKAVFLALQHDRALIRRGVEIHALLKDGSTEFISSSESYMDLWQDALLALEKKYS